MTKRNRQQHPVIGGVVNQGHGDTTKQGRRRTARRDAAEMARIGRADARKKLKLPTGKEVQEVDQTKER